MKSEMELMEGESIIKEMKGDYWEGSVFGVQKTGKYIFTNKKIIFRGGLVAALDLMYSDIASVRTCNVGGLIKFMPTGILVTMKDGKKYRLSVLQRKKIIELIESNI